MINLKSSVKMVQSITLLAATCVLLLAGCQEQNTPAPPTASAATTPTPMSTAEPLPAYTPTAAQSPEATSAVSPTPFETFIGDDTIFYVIRGNSYKYTPESESMTVEEIGAQLTAIMLERLKEPDDCLNLTYQITDFRNISIADIEFVEGENLPYYYAYWYAWPKAEIAYTGSYGLLGESDGTEYFNSEDMDMDRGIGRVRIMDKGDYYTLVCDIKKDSNIKSFFCNRSYQYTPEDEDMPIEEVAERLIKLLLEDLKHPDSGRTYQIMDYQNIEATQIKWYEDKQCWRALPGIAIAYIGYYGELGKSDGTQFFDHLGTDGGVGYIKITKDGGTIR